uniref:Uncharacterized protein n=1 Tax=Avena sativa TaxID=4498 RepID=A0ACD5TE49_AVESA
METPTLAELRAADADIVYSLHFQDGGRVATAAAVGCVCLDYLTCSECERILGQSFVAIELAVRKKQRTDLPVPVARVDAGPGQGHGVEESDGVAISGKAGQLGPGSHPPLVGVEKSDAVAISDNADKLGPGSHSPLVGVEKSDAAISATADQLWAGSHPPSDGVEASDAAAGMANRLEPGPHGVEGSDAAFSGTADRLGHGSHPSSDGVDAAISGMANRLGLGSHPPSPSDGVEGSDKATPSMADRLAPGSNGGVDVFETSISGMAARLGLAAAVGERAEEVFRKMEEARAWPHHRSFRRKDRNKGLLYAACISVACRNDNEGSARSLRELALATTNGAGAVSRWEIARLVAHIRRRLGEEEAGQGTCIGMVCASSYVRRFGELIRLGEAGKTAALKVARRVGEDLLDVRHSPECVAAAVVCLSLERVGARKSDVKDVAAATGITQSTIRKVCKKLRPHAEMLFG